MKALIMWDVLCLLVLLGLLSRPHPKKLLVWAAYAAWSCITFWIYKYSHHTAIASAVAGLLMIYISNRRAGKRPRA